VCRSTFHPTRTRPAEVIAGPAARLCTAQRTAEFTFRSDPSADFLPGIHSSSSFSSVKPASFSCTAARAHICAKNASEHHRAPLGCNKA